MVRTAQVQFDGRLYAADTIQRAAYRYCDRFSVALTMAADTILCAISFDKHVRDDHLEELASDFHKEVLDQHLRSVIRKETEQVRNLILAYTFSRTTLQH